MIAASEARRRAGRRGFAGELGTSPFTAAAGSARVSEAQWRGASSFPPRFSAAGTTPSPSTGVGGVSDLGRDRITGIREEPAGGESTRSESAVSSGPLAVIGESQTKPKGSGLFDVLFGRRSDSLTPTRTHGGFQSAHDRLLTYYALK
ncbi:MAG: hypothetical protein ACYC0X_33945 [Pirellulaceae bacterium]